MGVSIIRISGNVKFDVIFIALKALNYIIIDVPVCRAPCKYVHVKKANNKKIEIEFFSSKKSSVFLFNV
jgi:hypothetical protein